MKAQQVLTLLENVAPFYVDLPEPHRVSLSGEVVIPCAETRVAVVATELVPSPLNELACDTREIYTLNVTIARECAVEYTSTGAESDTSLNGINAFAAADADALGALFDALGEDPVLVPAAALTTRTGGIVTTLVGGMMYVTLTVRLD
jgi:hypothetical protein